MMGRGKEREPLFLSFSLPPSIVPPFFPSSQPPYPYDTKRHASTKDRDSVISLLTGICFGSY